MPKPFRFKQFTVHHDQCAMKIGTDAILLGAWATASAPQRILDIGTGSGVIALMLAQRFPAADVFAVEIDSAASEQAKANFADSSFRDRLTIAKSSVQDFCSDVAFDLIVCNPPWFHDSLKPPDTQRSLARHNDSLSLHDLATAAVRLLSPGGRLSLILPLVEADAFCNLADDAGLHGYRRCQVRPTPDSEPKRQLLEFSNQTSAGGPENCHGTASGFLVAESDSADFLTEQELVVETTRHQYSDDYTALAKEFLLKM